jgi:cysteine desulfuration protein SufE
MLTLLEAEAELVRKYRRIEDRQERLQVLLEQKNHLPGLRPEERVSEWEVHGCSSRLWMTGELAGGVIHWRIETESLMVRSLAGVSLCLCQKRCPEEVANWNPSWLEELDFGTVLSSTRRNGLARIHQRVRELARSFCGDSCLDESP